MTTKRTLHIRKESLRKLTLRLAVRLTPVTMVVAGAGCDIFFTAPCSM